MKQFLELMLSIIDSYGHLPLALLELLLLSWILCYALTEKAMQNVELPSPAPPISNFDTTLLCVIDVGGSYVCVLAV